MSNAVLDSKPRTQRRTQTRNTPAGLSAETLLTIVGSSNLYAHDINMLEAADKAARRFLRAGGGAFMSSSSEGELDHYNVFEAVTKACERDDDYDDVIKRFPPITDEDGHAQYAEDVAVHHWAPLQTAAYYFGVCIGLRLASGVR
jgi:hypothetical protein